MAGLADAGQQLVDGLRGVHHRVLWARALLAHRVEGAVEGVEGGMGQPGLEPVHILGGIGKVHDPGLPEAQRIAEFLRQALPDPQAFHHDRQFRRIASLLADPAPVAAALFARDQALFAERDLQAARFENGGQRSRK